MVIACDFDDTLCNTHDVKTGYRMGPPMDGAISVLTRLADEGHQIIIFTARNVQDQRVYKSVEDWLKYFKIPYHGITNVKRGEFEVIIDNRALHFQSWGQTYTDLRKAISNWDDWSNHPSQRQGMIDDITKPLDI